MVFTHPGMSSRARRWLPWSGGRAPLAHFLLAALAGFAILLILGPLAFADVPTLALAASAAVYMGGVALAAALLRRSYPHDRLGLTNVVTLSRMVLVASFVMPLVAGIDYPWTVLALALLALSMDGVDGWLARREGLVSAFGARFDMEVDSALALVLSLLAFASGSAGPLVLVLGLPRYAFAAAGLVFPMLDRPLPDRFGRKVVCVIQLATLIALQLPVLPGAVAAPLVAVAAAGLLWSFGRDIVWLWRERK
jgi:phosphatidylglycerophosphate synthase